MTKINIKRRTIGVNFTQGKTEVEVWAPHAKSVAISVNKKKPFKLTRQEFGYWLQADQKMTAGDLYQLIVDGETVPDSASLSQPEGVHGPSQVFDVNGFEWTDDKWANIPLGDYIFYELHTGTFTNAGTFEAIEQQLDYLVKLGITAIEIMPVAQFPGGRNWGYDGVFPFAVQNSYGGPRALQNLVNACHNKGLAVVLDVVYNHMGPEGNYFNKYGPYFTDKYKTPWGNAMNFDDAECDGVRHYFIENTLMWFRDFHIDALRMDAVHAIKDFSPKHILGEIRENVDKLMAATGKTHYLVVECDLNDTRFIEPLQEKGFGMDSQWSDEFHHALRVTAGGEKEGYYTDFDAITSLAEAYKGAYVYRGQYSAHREKSFGTPTENRPGEQFVVFSQNHDQVGNRMLGERTSQLFSFEMQKLMAAAVMVSPFLPMLFMGEEWGETNPFQYFVSHTDAELIELVREGRKKEFAAFHSKGEVPDPESTKTFDNSKLNWDLIDRQPHQTMLKYYQSLIALRKKQPVLKAHNRKNLSVGHDVEAKTITLKRWNDAQDIICFMNFSQSQQTAMVDNKGQWQLLFNSADPEWNGPATARALAKGSDKLTVQPESILVYTQHHV